MCFNVAVVHVLNPLCSAHDGYPGGNYPKKFACLKGVT